MPPRVLQRHRSAVHGLALLPDGDTLVSAEHSDRGNAALGLWSLSGGEDRKGPRSGWQCYCLHLVEEHSILYASHERGVDTFTISEDGRSLTKTKRALPFGAHELRRRGDRIVHITEGKAWLFDVAGKTDAKVRPGHRARTTGLGVSPDGERFATGSNEGVRVYDMSTGKLVAKMKFDEPERFPPVLTFLDANTIVTAASDVVWWDIERGAIDQRTPIGDSFEAYAIAEHDGQLVVGGRNFNAMGSDTKPVHVYDVASRARRHDLALETKGAGVACMKILPDHGLLALGTDYGPVELHPRPA